MSEHAHPPYVKIWGILVVLLVVSVVGPLFEIQWVTLITAFGIAVVKAYLVVKNFMHLNVEPRFVWYMVGTALAFMGLFYAGTSPDVMAADGDNWNKPAYQEFLEPGFSPTPHGKPTAAHH